MTRADRFVVGIEEILVGRIERTIGRQVGPQHEGFEEPRGMREMPLGRAGIRHRLHGLVFRRERLGERSRSWRRTARKRSSSGRACVPARYALSVSTRHLRIGPNAGRGYPVAGSMLASTSYRRGNKVPVCEIDPWRMQYFARVPCPADVFIPTEDSDAWLWNPAHRWVYDKLAVALSQGLEAAPHGVSPPHYPVFSKPIYNLKGMGVGSRRLQSESDYSAAYQPGHFWSTLLEGDHVSSDVVVIDGEPKWWRHARGITGAEGTFDYWEIGARAEPAIEDWTGAVEPQAPARLQRHHQSRDDRRAHHRGAICGSPTNGPISMAAIRGSKRWFVSMPRASGRSTTARREPATAWCCSRRMGGATATRRRRCSTRSSPCRASPACRSPFTRSWAPERHAMPPGGFRVAIVNCWDRAAGNAARERLRAHFES